MTSTKSRDPWLQGILINGGTMTHLLHQPQTGGEFSPTTNKTINGLQLDFNPTGVRLQSLRVDFWDNLAPSPLPVVA